MNVVSIYLCVFTVGHWSFWLQMWFGSLSGVVFKWVNDRGQNYTSMVVKNVFAVTTLSGLFYCRSINIQFNLIAKRIVFFYVCMRSAYVIIYVWPMSIIIWSIGTYLRIPCTYIYYHFSVRKVQSILRFFKVNNILRYLLLSFSFQK